MKNWNRLCGLLVVFALVVVACASGSAEETTTTTADERAATTSEAPEPAQATTTTETPAATTTTTLAPVTPDGVIPDPTTGVTLVPYADENITVGDVFVYWYRGANGGNYLALYTGPGVEGSEGQALCPGNSIATTEFLHISNTPVESGSCEGFPTAVASVQVCSGGVWIYETAIPGDVEGTLYGSLEWNAADGSVKGLTSQFPTTPDMSEFTYGLASYSLWSGFTSDGSSEVSCDPPMS